LSMGGNPVSRIDPLGNIFGWIEDNQGNVFWDENTNSQEEFKQNYSDKGTTGYNYVSDIDNPKSYTLPSGIGKLIMNAWKATNEIEDGSGHVVINVAFKATDETAEVGWGQTYSSNIIDVHSGNLYTVLPEENSSEMLDGFGVQQSSDVSLARYFEGYDGYGEAIPILYDGPQRAKNPGAQWDVTFNAQSTVLLNGNRILSLGWGFTVTSQSNQKIYTPMILKTTSDFHNRAIKCLSDKILLQ